MATRRPPSRAPRALIALALGALVAGSSGCRVGRAVIADPSDYAAYRKTRTLPSLEERLRAAERYLEMYPRGDFVADVQRAYARGEESLWVSKRGSVTGLAAYLEELPRGTHAAEARRELEARRAASVDVMGRRAAETEGRLASAAAERARAREELGAWLRRLGQEGVLGAAMTDAPGELVVAWSLSLPEPRCEADPAIGGRRCHKLIERPFAIPAGADGGGPRVLLLDVTVEEDEEGRLCAATLTGPSLFSRFEEADALRPADRGPMRAQAVRAATSLVRSSMEVTRPDAGPCRSDLGERGQLLLHCGETTIAVRAALAVGGDDHIRISRASACPAP